MRAQNSMSEQPEAPQKASWNMVPTEIKEMILQHLPGRFAAVCQEWQSIIERRTFETLAVTSTSLPDFREYLSSTRRQVYLKHLWLQIELPSFLLRGSALYPYVPYVKDHVTAQTEANHALTAAVNYLYRILAVWDPDEIFRARRGAGLSLELSTHSPSDGIDVLGLSWGTKGHPYINNLTLNNLTALIDHRHGVGGVLPDVDVVTELSILRRSRRRICAGSVASLAMSLPRLDRLHLEPWEDSSYFSECHHISKFTRNLVVWPVSLSKISIYRYPDEPRARLDPRPIKACSDLARIMAKRSLSLEQLLVCNLVDALDFFHAAAPWTTKALPVWERLRVFTMTSDVISPAGCARSIQNVLCLAGRAARRMPLLCVMEIYGAGATGAGLFRYQVLDTVAEISWVGTWEMQLSPQVRNIWSATARLRHNRLEPRILPERAVPNYQGPAKFVCLHLRTWPLVMHASSMADLTGWKGIEAPLRTLGRKIGGTTGLVQRDDESEALARLRFWTAELESIRARRGRRHEALAS